MPVADSRIAPTLAPFAPGDPRAAEGAASVAGRGTGAPAPSGRARRRGRPPLWARALALVVARVYLRRPEMAEPIAIRYRTLRAVLGGLANEVAYRLGSTRAPALLSANLELTNRCNLRCTFCPTADGRMERAKGFMSADLFRRALDGA